MLLLASLKNLKYAGLIMASTISLVAQTNCSTLKNMLIQTFN